MLTLQRGTFNLVTSLEAEVPGADERVPFVDLLQAAAKGVGEDETAYKEGSDWVRRREQADIPIGFPRPSAPCGSSSPPSSSARGGCSVSDATL